MSGRLIIAIVSTILEETAIVAVVLWGLPFIGIYIPLGWLVFIVLAWLAFSVFVYKKGTLALLRKPVLGLPSMVGSKGKTLCPLAPGGTVKIKGEIWYASSVKGKINAGDEVLVIGQEGLKLFVEKYSKN